MKRLLLSLFILICFTLIGIYLFIPADIKFSKLVFIKTKLPIASRALMDKSNWVKWSSLDSVSTEHNKPGKITFRFKNSYYTIENVIMNAAQISISNNKKSINSLMSLIPIEEDSVAVEWKGEIDAGLNPISRIKSYKEAKEIQSDMGEILLNFQTFLEKKENAYGFNVTQQQVVDTLLISTKYISDTFPSTVEIYSLINNLQKYISNQDARETNPPMLNITKDSNTYRTMVAIPVNKIIPEKGNYIFKRMIPGKILVAQIKGGAYTSMQALKQLDLYIVDNHLSSPAIPFESLITNRSLEPDTTKWITKIYYPIY